MSLKDRWVRNCRIYTVQQSDSHVCAVQQTVRNIPLPALSNGHYSDIKFFNEDNAITKIYYLLIEKGGILKKGY